MGNGGIRGERAITHPAPLFYLDGKGGDMSFFEQYKSPEWQKKRLEALDSAEFRCQRCFDGESQLNVHHKRYIKGRKVWDYDKNELEVLCDSCHQTVHVEKDRFNAFIASFPSEAIDEFYWLLLGFSSERTGAGGWSSHQDSPTNEYEARMIGFGIGAATAANKPIKIGGK